MKAYKGFNKNLQCRGFQYEVGKEYTEPTAKACERGFHACENALDCFGYYPPGESVYHEVECMGQTDTHDDDSKIACTHIRIGAEVGLTGIVAAGVKFIFDRIDWTNAKQFNTGDRSAATNTGDRSAATNTGDQSAATNTGNRSAATNTGYQSAATNTGDQSAATNTGDRSAASVEGQDSIACGLGYQNKAKAAIGCGIVLAERGEWNGKTYPLIAIKSTIVDGKKIKADTWYVLQNGKFVIDK